MRSKFCRRIGSVLCAMAVALWLSAAFFVSSAASAKGNLEILCKSEGYPLFAQNWSVYRVGELTGAGTIELQGEFADSQVYLPDLSSSSLLDAASSLENFAVLEPVKPDATAVSDLNGSAYMADLPDGIYLASGKRITKGSKIYTPVPMLVQVTGGMTLTAHAKYTVKDKPTINTQIYRVMKVWQYDDSYIESRPVEIEVGIYRDNALVEKVTLSKDNNWTYDWTGDPASEWRVKEININGSYKVVYRHNETQYLLINNRDVLSNSGTTTQPTTTSTTTTTTTSRPVITMSSEITTTTTTTGQVTGFSETTSTTVSRDTVTSSGEETTTTTSGDVGEITTTSTETVTTDTDETGTTTSEEGTTTVKGTTTKPSGGGKLPQTGQLWWPVPACGAAGLVLFVLGWRLNRKK